MSDDIYKGYRWRCAWKGCEESHTKPMPQGWRNVLIWYSPEPESQKTIGRIANRTTCDRDIVLCPEHATELDRLLVVRIATQEVPRRQEH